MPNLVYYVVSLLVIGLVFTPFLALFLTGFTLLLGKMSTHFQITLPEDWKFRQLFLRYLIIAGVYTIVTIPVTLLVPCAGVVIGIVAMTAAYGKVFDADWLQAVVIGGVGGAMALVLFLAMVVPVLQLLGL